LVEVLTRTHTLSLYVCIGAPALSLPKICATWLMRGPAQGLKVSTTTSKRGRPQHPFPFIFLPGASPVSYSVPTWDQGYQKNLSSAAITRGSGMVQTRPQSNTAMTRDTKAPPSTFLLCLALACKNKKNAMVGTMAAQVLAALRKAHSSSCNSLSSGTSALEQSWPPRSLWRSPSVVAHLSPYLPPPLGPELSSEHSPPQSAPKTRLCGTL
jgi:hypothetical protein